MSLNPLTFEKLRTANLERCNKHFHPLDDWSECEWGCALSGEVGELCNFLKKRLRIAKKSNYPRKSTMDELNEGSRKEIGDILSYLDLLAARMGFKLEECVREKFNEVSERVKSDIKL